MELREHVHGGHVVTQGRAVAARHATPAHRTPEQRRAGVFVTRVVSAVAGQHGLATLRALLGGSHVSGGHVLQQTLLRNQDFPALLAAFFSLAVEEISNMPCADMSREQFLVLESLPTLFALDVV